MSHIIAQIKFIYAQQSACPQGAHIPGITHRVRGVELYDFCLLLNQMWHQKGDLGAARMLGDILSQVKLIDLPVGYAE